MAFKALIEKFRNCIWPAPVAPFVTLIAEAMVNHPGEFDVKGEDDGILVIRLRENAKGVDKELVDNGVGVEFNHWTRKLTIVTYYFDDVPLNWRERRVMMDAMDQVVDAYYDALTMLTGLDSSFDPA